MVDKQIVTLDTFFLPSLTIFTNMLAYFDKTNNSAITNELNEVEVFV